MCTLKRLWKNSYFKAIVAIIIIVAIVLGFFISLHTSYPVLTVISPSMFIETVGSDYLPGPNSDYVSLGNIWFSLTHPFSRTLSVGDIVIVEGVNPKDLKTDYPNSDIIIFYSPEDNRTLIVHRIIGVENIDGTLYFETKGDGNGYPDVWPQTPTGGFDPWDPQLGGKGVPQSDVVGKVVMRIPWFGWVTMVMRDNSFVLPIIIALILLLVILEFVIPLLREKKPQQESPKQV